MRPIPLTIALREEIGDPNLFIGRHKDLDFFLDWVDLVARELGQSQVILARKRRGKTALVQRLYNILYSRADPKIIPFYIRVPEGKMTTLDYCEYFMRNLLSQILGFVLRKPQYIRSPPAWGKLENLLKDEEVLREQYDDLKQLMARNATAAAWDHVREAGHHISMALDVKIIQIIDEFQFLNEFFYRDEALTTREELATFYQKTGSSKVSPQIITGSYIGWLSKIVNHMVGRYFHYYLDRLPENEAIARVYRYATVFGSQVSEQSAAYMATVCDNDPYYIASLFQHPMQGKNLCDEASTRKTLDEVTTVGGAVANMWLEYILSAFQSINDTVAKTVVIYLAHHKLEQRSRRQIIDDCGLKISEDDLEKRLQQLVYADVIRQGDHSLVYRGLGDPIFAMVFRKRYEQEITGVTTAEILGDIEAQLVEMRGRVSYYKGMAAEDRVAKKLVFLSIKGLLPADLISGPPKSLRFELFSSAYEHVFQLVGGNRIAVDIYCQGKEHGPDLVVEVKDWKEKPGRKEIDTFLALKRELVSHLMRPTIFIFHSEVALGEKMQAYILENGLWYSDGNRLSEL